MYRLIASLIIAGAAYAQCRLPDVAPGALDRLSPTELVDAGHFLRAEKLLDPIVKNQPEDTHAAWLLSRAKAALGEFEPALALAESAVATDPNSATYHVQLAAVAGRIAEKSSLLKQLTFAKRARQELDAALKLDTNNIEAQYGLMVFYFAAPGLIGGDKNKSVQIGEQIAAIAPDRGRYYQGRLALQMKDIDKAETYFRQAALDNPISYDNAAALAKLYIEQKRDQARAETWACQAVHTDPTRADAWALLARVYTMCGCWTEALEMAHRADTIDGENQAPAYAIADVAVSRGEQLDMAVELLRKYLSQPPEGEQPSAALAHMRLGTAFSKMGKQGDAVTELRAALEADPGLEAAKAELKRVSAAERAR